MPHRRTFRNFTHLAWAIWDLSNLDLLWIIPDGGRQTRITSSLEYIGKIPFQARAGDVKIPELGQHCSNRGKPCIICIFGTFQGTGDQPKKNPGTLSRCTADIFSNITDRDSQRPGMPIAWKIGPVRLVGCTNDWHNSLCGRKLILRIPPPVAGVDLTVYSVTLRVGEVHRFKIQVRLKWEMCQTELDTVANIPVV